MGDIKLFQLANGQVNTLLGVTETIEKSVQTLFEKNLEAFLGVRFLASEFTTTHGGRIDTLGLDENGCPVILEYKRSTNENVINQGLFYLDWLMDHRKDFQWLVLEKLGKTAADAVDWSAPRLICIAGDFNRYDDHAVKQIQRNIELIRYRRFGQDLLMLDLVSATAVSATSSDAKPIAVVEAGSSASSIQNDNDSVIRARYCNDRPFRSPTCVHDGAWRRCAGNDTSVLHRVQTDQEFRLRRISSNNRENSYLRKSQSSRSLLRAEFHT